MEKKNKLWVWPLFLEGVVSAPCSHTTAVWLCVKKEPEQSLCSVCLTSVEGHLPSLACARERKEKRINDNKNRKIGNCGVRNGTESSRRKFLCLHPH